MRDKVISLAETLNDTSMKSAVENSIDLFYHEHCHSSYLSSRMEKNKQ